MTYLGIDLGTSSLKMVLTDEKARVLAKVSVALKVSRPVPLWSEQDPEDWWQALRKAFSLMRYKKPEGLKKVRVMGLSGQMHGATLLDKAGHVLRPAILWNDGRSFAECLDIEKAVPDFAKITGNRVMPGFTAPKLLWVKKHEPEIFEKVDKVLLPKDYLRYRLSGEFISDLSDSAGTSWLDTGKRAWSDSMLSATFLNKSHMPEVVEGTELAGIVSNQIAEELGLSKGVKIAGGGGDNAASAISMNVIAKGDAFLSLGTSGVFFVANDQYQFNADRAVHTFCHAIPNHWHHMAVHLSAACCLDWCARLVNTKLPELLDLTTKRPKLANDVFFLPYLSGERTPFNNPHARGVFFGLNHDTNSKVLMQAVLEGVTFAFMTGAFALKESGIGIGDVSVVGGGARIPYWGKLLASALDIPLIYRENREVGGAFGAALLARHLDQGGDILTNLPYSPIDHVQKPDAKLRDYFATQYPKFLSIYNGLNPVFGKG